MQSITFTVGPPGAGKSRWAHQQVAERGLHNVQRVNLDDFLTMTHGRASGELSSSDLKLTKRMLVNVIRTIAESGRDVIVDNTHLSTRFPNMVRDELGDEYEYKIQDFTGVPLRLCMERDTLRASKSPDSYVGAEELTSMWNKAQSLQRRFGGDGLPDWVAALNRPDGILPYVGDPSLPSAVIIDVDGTMALHAHRGPYDTSLYHTDELERRLAQLVDILRASDEKIHAIVLTGRYEEHRDVTQRWFSDTGAPVDELYMRADGDSRRDNEIKLDLFNAYVRDRFNVLGAFDDRDRVVRLWRRLGLMTYQVAFGDF